MVLSSSGKPDAESTLQRNVLRIIILQKRNEIQQVGGVERAVLKMQEFFQIGILVVAHKIIRRIVHQLQQLRAFIDDDGAVAPRKQRRKKTGDLDILLHRKPVRDGDRVGCDK